MTDDIEFTPDDIQAARGWLFGDIKEGSSRDLQARRTLARMLRSNPPEKGLLFVLADAIDPDGEGGKRLFLKRKPGRPRRINSRHIAAFIYQRKQAKGSFESAVSDAMGEFRCGRTTVTGAWKKWRPFIEQNPKLFVRI